MKLGVEDGDGVDVEDISIEVRGLLINSEFGFNNLLNRNVCHGNQKWF